MNKNRERSAKNNKSRTIGIVVVVVLALLQAAAEGSAYILLPVLIVGAVVGVMVWIVVKVTKQPGGAKTGAATPGKAPQRQRSFAPPALSRAAGRFLKKADCDYGRANHAYSHDMKKRIEQLDSFLKNGIIEKEEYNILLRKYEEAEKYHF